MSMRCWLHMLNSLGLIAHTFSESGSDWTCKALGKIRKLQPEILVPVWLSPILVPRAFVPLDQRSENESSRFPTAGQRERRLWGREWLCPCFQVQTRFLSMRKERMQLVSWKLVCIRTSHLTSSPSRHTHHLKGKSLLRSNEFIRRVVQTAHSGQTRWKSTGCLFL